MDSLFSWLHISDIHFGHGDASQVWDQRLVISELRADIAKAQKNGYPHPDVVLLTGDVAFSGGVLNRGGSSPATEYGEAKDWLNGLMKDLGLPPERVFIVPGNHDIQRNVDRSDRNVHRLVHNLREGFDSLDSVWGYPDDEVLLARRQANYLDFASSFGVKTTRLFWMEQVKARTGLTVRLVGLNSSLLCADDKDTGKLDIGNEQVGLTLLRPPIEPTELVVALTHHPFDWLRNAATAVPIVERYAHVHLCGHVHEADSKLISTGGGTHLVHVVAGAVHDLATPNSAPLRYGYNFGSIHAATDGIVTLRIWPRAWSAKKKEFQLDIDNVPDGERNASHPLRFRSPSVLPQAAGETAHGTENLARASAALQRKSSYFAPLYEASKAVLAQFGLERRQILQQIILPAMGGIVGHQEPSTLLGTIQLYDEDRDELILDSVYPLERYPELTDRIGEHRSLRAKLGNKERIGITGRTVLSARSQLVPDVRRDADYIEFTPATLSELTVPLFDRDGKVIGVLSVESDHSNAFDEEDQEALQTLAGLVVAAIQNSRQVEALRSHTTLAFMGLQNAVSRHELAGQMGILLTKLQHLEESLTGDNSSQQTTKAILADIERSAQGFTLDWPKDQTYEELRSVLVNEELVVPFQKRFLETHPDWSQRFATFSNLDSMVRIRVNVDWFFRVLDILVSNAAQAAAHIITLGSRPSSRQDWVEILVSDDGQGLPPEMREHLFREPIRKGSKGLGLGLLVAQAIVRIYDGQIYWEDRKPRGTTLVLSFPIEKPPVAAPAIPHERLPNDSRSATAKVLLADNDPEQLQAWSDVLRGAGYEVVQARFLSEAQEFLIKGGLDLAILDLRMQNDEDESDDSGLRLAQIFRESVPIILLTGNPTVSAAVAALQRDGRSSPAVAFVRKLEDGPRVLLQAARKAIIPKVFVSYGRDENARAAVVKFLKDNGAHAVVLQEQPQTSRTIDAFEEYANVQFAVVLITLDEEGRLKGDDSLQSRVRQNVIFDLGFLLAKLGRNRVVALCSHGVSLESPSNYQGVLYLELDARAEWQEKVRSAMRAAGIPLA